MDRLTQKYIKTIMSYNESTGISIRKVAAGNQKKGNKIGTVDRYGHLRVKINNKQYQLHRIIWLYVYGYMPESDIDHINRNPSDNRIVNLRESSHQCNMRNSKLRITNKTGVTGVSFKAKRKLYSAGIGVNNEWKELGLRKLMDEAVKLRWYAEVKYGYPNCNTISTSYMYLKERKLI